MATCNDCLHYEACKKIFQISFKDFTDYTFVKTCELYKPTSDVVEVVHGRWIRHKENCLYNKCSICCYEHCRENNYCPNCGAKMDGTPKERSEG